MKPSEWVAIETSAGYFSSEPSISFSLCTIERPLWYDEGTGMVDRQTVQERELMRRWVETWRRAGPQLDEIRRHEIGMIDTREAIRQLFGSATAYRALPPRTTSGLVEQQAWFAKLRQ